MLNVLNTKEDKSVTASVLPVVKVAIIFERSTKVYEDKSEISEEKIEDSKQTEDKSNEDKKNNQ